MKGKGRAFERKNDRNENVLLKKGGGLREWV